MSLDAAGREAFSGRLSEAAALVEAALSDLLPAAGALGPRAPVTAAMRHAVLNGGKRLRGFLAVESAGLFGAAGAGAERVAAAAECLHAYSLVHDDLPCMDDDALRRGQPTVHVKWDEATAVLAGDALQTLAFEILAGPETHPEGAVRAELCLALARASGALGMVGGQALDIAAETAEAPLKLAEIERLQGLKTGALIAFATESGAILGRADPAARAALRRYARALGIAFQIQDDVLDVAGDAEAAGKALRKDGAAGKATFVSLLGLEGARARAAELAAQAEGELARFGPAARPLSLAARFVVSRGS
jgi:farnesyl diphosphate synthase